MKNEVSRIHPKSFPDTLEASRRPRNMFWDRFGMPEIFQNFKKMKNPKFEKVNAIILKN